MSSLLSPAKDLSNFSLPLILTWPSQTSRRSAAGDQKWPGASSNMTDFRFCEVQNGRRKCCSLVRKMMWSPKKKTAFTEILTVFPVEIRWSVFPVESLQASHADFSVLFRWAPSRAHGPSAGPAEVNGLPEAHGPPKVHGPRGHCTSLPPHLGTPASRSTSRE